MAAIIRSRQGIFSFQAHRRNGITDFVGEAGRPAANRGQPFGGGCAPSRLGETYTGRIQCLYQAVKFALSGQLQSRQIGLAAIAIDQRSLQARKLA